jgi:hypothetical protein
VRKNPWRFRLRLQIINGTRRLIIDRHWEGMGVCIKIRKADYEFLKHAGIHEQKATRI